MPKVYVGIDAGKEFHWASVVDGDGGELLSRRVDNDEAPLSALVEDVHGLGEAIWAVDIPGGVAALTLAVLWQAGERVVYLPGIAVDRSRDGYRGESKTDARDARLIAEAARMRHDLSELRPSDDMLAELQALTSFRRDLVADQTRTITRLRDALIAVAPALEREFPFTTKGALMLVRRYQTPTSIRRAGKKRLESYLRAKGVRGAADIADRAVRAAQTQSLSLPAESVTAAIVADLATEALRLKDRINTVDAELEQRFFSHPQAKILTSLPGMGARLGAEFLVAVGDIANFDTADQLAAYAGLAPAARDSGKYTGIRRRMHGGNKVLKRVFYQAAFASLRSTDSRSYYDRKRTEGKRHNQAVIALARRRINVLWAMLRDETTFKPRAA